MLAALKERTWLKMKAGNNGGYFVQVTPEPDIWFLIFEQTPRVLRFVLGFLSFGLFTLAGWWYKRHRQDMRKMEEDYRREIRAIVERQNNDMCETRKNINRVHSRIDDINEKLNENAKEIADSHERMYQLLINMLQRQGH